MKEIVAKLMELGMEDPTNLVSEYYYSFVGETDLKVSDDEEGSKLIRTDKEEDGSVVYYKEIKIKNPNLLSRRLGGNRLSTSPKRKNTANINLKGGYKLGITLTNIQVNDGVTTFEFTDEVEIINRMHKRITLDKLISDPEFQKKVKVANLLSGW